MRSATRPRRAIALIGLNGSGKTALAPILAQQLGWPWFDVDQLLEQHIGRPISEILQYDGETYRRAVEREILYDLLHTPYGQPVVIATDCGIVSTYANRRLLSRAYGVWLDAPTPTLTRRLALHEQPDIVIGRYPVEEYLESLRAAYTPYYRTLVRQPLNTDGMTLGRVANMVLEGYERQFAPASSTSSLSAPLDVAS